MFETILSLILYGCLAVAALLSAVAAFLLYLMIRSGRK